LIKLSYIFTLFLSSCLSNGLASESVPQNLQDADDNNFEIKVAPEPFFIGKSF